MKISEVILILIDSGLNDATSLLNFLSINRCLFEGRCHLLQNLVETLDPLRCRATSESAPEPGPPPLRMTFESAEAIRSFVVVCRLLFKQLSEADGDMERAGKEGLCIAALSLLRRRGGRRNAASVTRLAEVAASSGHVQFCTLVLLRFGAPEFALRPQDLPTLENRIGSGGFGTVYCEKWVRLNGKPVAVKRIHATSLNTSAEGGGGGGEVNRRVGRFLLEIVLLSKVSGHAGFPRFLGACLDQKHLALVMSWVPLGSLFGFLHSERPLPGALQRQFPSINQFCAGIASAMAYLHSLSIIHRDLTSANVLLDVGGGEDGGTIVPKISDLGISRFTRGASRDSYSASMTKIGCQRYIAPEVAKGSRYSAKVDVYGFALVLFELLTRRVPFAEERSGSSAMVRAARGERPAIDGVRQQHPAWADFLEQLWAQDPHDRPAFSVIFRLLDGESATMPQIRLPKWGSSSLVSFSASFDADSGSAADENSSSSSQFSELRILPDVSY